MSFALAARLFWPGSRQATLPSRTPIECIHLELLHVLCYFNVAARTDVWNPETGVNLDQLLLFSLVCKKKLKLNVEAGLSQEEAGSEIRGRG